MSFYSDKLNAMENIVPIYTPVKVTSYICGLKVFSTSKWDVIWSVFYIIFLTIIDVIVHLVAEGIMTHKITEIIKASSYTIITICISVVLVFIKHHSRYKIRVMVKKVESIHQKLQKEFPGVKSDDYQCLTVYFYLVHIAFFASYVAHMKYIFGENYMYFVTGESILQYFTIAIAFQIVSLVSSLGKVLDMVNNCLVECKIGLERNPKKPIGLKIETMMDIFKELFDMVGVVNESFGIPVLFMYLILLLHLVTTLTTVLRFRLIMKVLNLGVSVSLGVSCLISLVLAYLISSSYSDVKGKFRLSALYVFEAIISQSKGIWTLQKGLIVLHGCLTTRPFNLTAADFFDVDFTLMFSLVGSVCYYVVVFVQM